MDSASLSLLALCLGLPFAVSLILTGLLLRWALWLGLIDQPSQRKIHTTPTPRGGGLAIFLALVVSQLVPMLQFPGNSWLLGFGAGVVILGLVDDWRPLPWQLRLGIQTAAAAAALVCIGAIPGLNGGNGDRIWLPWPLALLWIVALTNAFNMLDNMDALSAGVAWIASLFLAIAALFPITAPSMSWDLHRGTPYLLLMGAIAGFLWYNRPPARIFMGDAGSTFLGFFLGVQTLRRDFADPAQPVTWIVPVCILAVAWYDLSTVVLIRLSQGRSPFHADKQHLSHRLMHFGFRSPKSVGIIYLIALAAGTVGLLSRRLPGQMTTRVIGELLAGWLIVASLEWALHRRWCRSAKSP